MECNNARRQIVPYIKGQLSINDCEKFIEHVNGCSECMDELEIYYILEHGLSDEDDNVSYDFKKMLESQLELDMSQIHSERRRESCYSFVYNMAELVLLITCVIYVIAYII